MCLIFPSCLKTRASENAVGVLRTYPPYLNIVKLVEILNDRGTVDGNSDNYCCGNAESRVGRGSHLCSEVKPCLANMFLVFSFCFLFSVIPTV